MATHRQPKHSERYHFLGQHILPVAFPSLSKNPEIRLYIITGLYMSCIVRINNIGLWLIVCCIMFPCSIESTVTTNVWKMIGMIKSWIAMLGNAKTHKQWIAVRKEAKYPCGGKQPTSCQPLPARGLSYFSYAGMCRWIGYGFQNRQGSLRDFTIHSMDFRASLLEKCCMHQDIWHQEITLVDGQNFHHSDCCLSREIKYLFNMGPVSNRTLHQCEFSWTERT